MLDSTKKRPPIFLRRLGWIAGGIVLAVFLAFIFGYFVMLLWNWVMPALFNLPVIDYWMAFGIIILARLIFGGIGGNGHSKKDHHDRYYGSKFKRKFSRDCGPMSKWSHYEEYWKEEGEQSFKDFVARKEAEKENNPAI
ncbi:MAG: hypothetical protein K9G76_11845 [Bacteroidales bacterium]|nr:hypothetical protein [Bacteroidales bacterium]MCF8405135.1 hypothetical protein [Bacteroidales bacterium]